MAATDAAAKPKLSGKLMQLKFMQRAVEKDRVAEAEVVQAAVVVSEHWVAPAGRDGTAQACTVIMEGDPKPGALMGRMSFKSFNVETEKLHAAAEAELTRRAALASGSSGDASVSDEAMARKLAGGVKGKAAAAGRAAPDAAPTAQPPAKRAKGDAAAAAAHRGGSGGDGGGSGGFKKPAAFDGGRFFAGHAQH